VAHLRAKQNINRQNQLAQLRPKRLAQHEAKWVAQLRPFYLMYSIPSVNEINRIYLAIQEDRKTKTLRIKEALSKIVGYRESKEFSRKSGVSDSSIRDILEGKKARAGYDIINRLELFLYVTKPEFELSIENPLNVKNYTYEYIGEITSQISDIADRIKQYCFKLTETSRKMEKERDWSGKEVEPTQSLKYNIEKLSELKEQIDSYWKIYIDRK
jgi:transcriptional regulator with XRE-family HTH domain